VDGKSLARPLIKITNADPLGMGHKTLITLEDGTEMKGVSEVIVTMRPGELSSAQITVLGLNGTFPAWVKEMREKIIPPPLPTETTELFIGTPVRRRFRMMHHWRLERRVPMNTYGTMIEVLSEGWIPELGLPTPLRLST
jgi:hypothetical protein